MNLDYEKLQQVMIRAIDNSKYNVMTEDECMQCARAVIAASGLLEEVERLKANLINTVNALENVGRHKGLLAGERAALEDAKAAMKG